MDNFPTAELPLYMIGKREKNLYLSSIGQVYGYNNLELIQKRYEKLQRDT